MSDPHEAVRSAFGPLLALTARQWRRAVDRGLQPFGLTEATWLPLLRLARAPEAMRQKELAASLSLGNFAQAFTHLALISAAVNLDRALGNAP